METLIYGDGIYVPVSGFELRDEVDVESDQNVILSLDKTEAGLFGGRIRVENVGYYNDKVQMTVDGIDICSGYCFDKESGRLQTQLSFSAAAAYLNQMNQLGVDTFLNNYKDQISLMKTQLESEHDKLMQEDKIANSDRGNKIREILDSLISLFFMLCINLNAGIDNHQYEEAYNGILNMYFQ